MAAERPSIDQFMAQRSPAASGPAPIDSFMTMRAKKKASPSIYRKGGVYEQFGPNPPVFNPMPGPMGGPIQTGADQPGAALPFVGQVAGGMFGGPVYGVGGAVVGEGVRQGVGRLFGVQDEGDPGQQFQAAARSAAQGEAFGIGTNLAMRGAGSVIEAAKPGAKKAAIRSARNIIRPTGKLRKRGDRIAETALKEDVLSSNRDKMKGRIGQKLEAVDQEVDDLISQASSGKITAEDALRRVDALSRAYRQRGDATSAKAVLDTKDALIKAYGLEKPVFGNVTKPDDLGVSVTSREQIGKEARDISIPEAQGIKRSQYGHIKGKKQMAWDSKVSPDLEARQEFAGGVRRSMGDQVPGLNDANRRFGDLIELQDAVSGRDSVASRNNFFDLGDVVLASQGGGGAVAVLARKLAQSGQGAAARQLYKFGTSGPSQIPVQEVTKSLSPAVRALYASIRRAQTN